MEAESLTLTPVWYPKYAKTFYVIQITQTMNIKEIDKLRKKELHYYNLVKIPTYGRQPLKQHAEKNWQMLQEK